MTTPRVVAPAQIRVGGVCYELADEWGLVVTGPGAPAPPDARWELPDERMAVVPLAGKRAVSGVSGPVYRSGEGGSPAVPSGRVFVRFREGERVEARGADLERAGFRVESVPAWAPHTAWVRALGGGIAEALNGLENLAGVEGVEHVEAQLLRPRQSKGGSGG